MGHRQKTPAGGNPSLQPRTVLKPRRVPGLLSPRLPGGFGKAPGGAGGGGRRDSSAHLAGQKGSGCFLLGTDEEVEPRRHREELCQPWSSRDTRAAPSLGGGSSRKRGLGGSGSQVWAAGGPAAQRPCPTQAQAGCRSQTDPVTSLGLSFPIRH